MSGDTRRVVAATESPYGHLTVFCDDGSVFEYLNGMWLESDPVPGTEAAQAAVAPEYHDKSQTVLDILYTDVPGNGS